MSIGVGGKKEPRPSGEIIVAVQSRVVFRDATSSPCWDVVFTGSDTAVISCWDGTLIFLAGLDDLSPRIEARLPVGGRPYGLAYVQGQLYCSCAERGIIRIGITDQRIERVLDLRVAAYNVSADPLVPDRLAVGSTAGYVSVVGLDGPLRAGRPGADVSAIALSDGVLLTGGLEGTFCASHLSCDASVLEQHSFSDSIWSITYDPGSNQGFVARGDGALGTFELNSQPSSLSVDEAVQLTSPFSRHDDRLNALNGIGLKAVALRMAREAGRFSDEELRVAKIQVAEWLSVHGADDVLQLLAGTLALKTGDWDSAIEQFQAVSRDSPQFGETMVPISQAFEQLGNYSAAIRALREGLDTSDKSALIELVAQIGRLQEARSDWDGAQDSYEFLSYLDHSYPGLRSALARVRESRQPSSKLLPTRLEVPTAELDELDTGGSLGTRRQNQYDFVAYLQYEYGSAADNAKKLLETHLMSSLLRRRAVSIGTALDIGCATGRWPLWLASQGWTVEGYDISPHAIRICRHRAERQDVGRASFHQHDISQGPLSLEVFDLVTCMMGTFNHVPRASRPSFFDHTRESMKGGALFAFSIWNLESPFCDFLSLDSQAAKEGLAENSISSGELYELLPEHGFAVAEVHPFAYLPNTCYDLWEDELSGEGLTVSEVDTFLGNGLHPRRAQMSLIVAVAT